MVTITWLGLLIIKPKILWPSRASVQVVNKIIDESPGESFYVLLTSLLEKHSLIPKQMIKQQMPDRPKFIVSAEFTLFKPKTDTVAAMHYKQVVDRDI